MSSSSFSTGIGNQDCYLTLVDGGLILLAGEPGALWLGECAYASSSSGDVQPELSTLVRGYLFWQGKRRDTAFVQAVLDLSEPDQFMLQGAAVDIQLGGTFDGVKIPYQTLACVDGTTLRVCIGKVPAKQAQLVGKAWFEAMVMRVRATLDIARSAGPRPPKDNFKVI